MLKLQRFTYPGSDIYVSAGCEPEVNRHLGQVWGVMDSLDHGVLSVPVQEDERPSLQVLCASSLALRMCDLDFDQGSETET